MSEFPFYNTPQEAEADCIYEPIEPGKTLVVKIPEENREWGYDPLKGGTEVHFLRYLRSKQFGYNTQWFVVGYLGKEYEMNRMCFPTEHKVKQINNEASMVKGAQRFFITLEKVMGRICAHDVPKFHLSKPEGESKEVCIIEPSDLEQALKDAFHAARRSDSHFMDQSGYVDSLVYESADDYLQSIGVGESNPPKS